MTAHRVLRLAAAALLATSMGTGVAQAAWPPDGLPLASGANRQYSPLGLTGPNGELHAYWVDGTSATHALFAQHLTIEGAVAPGWPAEGRGVVARPAYVSSPIATADGAGGALIAWFDHRDGARGVYATRVDAGGTPAPGFASSGTPVCTTFVSGLGPLDQLMAICPDGAGGAFVAWTDTRNSPVGGLLVYDVVAHHVLANGTLDPSWPATGMALTQGPGYRYPHGLVSDDAGGFWLMTEAAGDPSRITAVHHDPAGTPIGSWTSPGFASRVAAVRDGAGGVFVSWDDCRNCPSVGDAIYAVRLQSNGGARPGWPLGGVEIGSGPDGVELPLVTATGDGAAMVSWLRAIPSAPDAYVARRIEANGTFAPGWQDGGTVFAESYDVYGWPEVAPDGAGGAMFAYRLNRPNLYGSRVDAIGNVPAAFPDTGLALCSVSGDQFLSELVSDGLNGAYVLWEDRRAGFPDIDVYVTRFTRNGEVGSTTSVDPPSLPPSRGIGLAAPRPNPSAGAMTYALTLRALARVRVEVLDLAGRLIALPFDGALDAGVHSLGWNGLDRDGREAPAGVYLLRASAAGATASLRIVRL